MDQPILTHLYAEKDLRLLLDCKKNHLDHKII